MKRLMTKEDNMAVGNSISLGTFSFMLILKEVNFGHLFKNLSA